MQIIDTNTGYKPLVGFSTKSQIGAPSTLMNASQATNLTFKISGIDDEIMNKINSIEGNKKVVKRFEELYRVADKVEFFDVKNEVFKDNLEMIDSKMPEIISNALVYRFRDNIKNYKEIVNLLMHNNELS